MNDMTARLAEALRQLYTASEMCPEWPATDQAMETARQALAAYDDRNRPLMVGDRVRVLTVGYPTAVEQGMETEITELFPGGTFLVRGTRPAADGRGWIFYPDQLERI